MESQKKKNIKSPPFSQKIYDEIPLSDLVLYSIFSLQNQKIETNFENIAVECFELFPLRFSFQSYPEYPDANRVRRELQRMGGGGFQTSDIQLIEGNLKTTYKITNNGIERLKTVQNRLKTGVSEKGIIKRQIKDNRGKIGRVLSEIERNPLYRKFLADKENFKISEPLLRDLLFATMETSNDKLRSNLKTLIEYCEAANRQDLKSFLIVICNKFSYIFK